MSEKKKSLIVLVALAVLLVLIIVVITISSIESKKKLDAIKTIMNTKEPQIIYISKPTCYYCNLIEPITTSLEKEFNLDYFHINTGNLSNSELLKTLEIIGINPDTFGTPYIAIVQDGKIIGEQVGYTDENVLFELFKEHSLIDEETSLNMNYLDDLDTVWNQDKPQLLLIGESGDTASIEARINLRRLSNKHSFEINYFDTSKLQNSKDDKEFIDKLEKEQLPILVIVQNGNVVDSASSASQKDYETFLTENNYIK